MIFFNSFLDFSQILKNIVIFLKKRFFKKVMFFKRSLNANDAGAEDTILE